MKIPEEINWYPADIARFEDSEGLWLYIPKWLVRAYRLKPNRINMGQVKVIIKKTRRAPIEWNGEEKGASEYYKRNWISKLRRERKMKRKGEL